MHNKASEFVAYLGAKGVHYSCDCTSPGHFFIAYYEWHHHERPHFHFIFAYTKSYFFFLKIRLTLKGIDFAEGEYNSIIESIPYLGNELRIPKKPITLKKYKNI